jgi:hypothetical protein
MVEMSWEWLDPPHTINMTDGKMVRVSNKRRRHVSDEFSSEILKDLVAKGFSGDELLRRFEVEQAVRSGFEPLPTAFFHQPSKVAAASPTSPSSL